MEHESPEDPHTHSTAILKGPKGKIMATVHIMNDVAKQQVSTAEDIYQS